PHREAGGRRVVGGVRVRLIGVADGSCVGDGPAGGARVDGGREGQGGAGPGGQLADRPRPRGTVVAPPGRGVIDEGDARGQQALQAYPGGALGAPSVVHGDGVVDDLTLDGRGVIHGRAHRQVRRGAHQRRGAGVIIVGGRVRLVGADRGR